MTKLQQIIKAFLDQGTQIAVFKPGAGYVLGKVTGLDDDVVTVKPDHGLPFILHYTQFSVERD